MVIIPVRSMSDSSHQRRSLSMVRMSLDCDISIWLKYDITTWGLQLKS